MFARLFKFAYGIPSRVSIKEYRHFVIGRVAFTTSILFHTILLYAFFYFEVMGLVVFNILSIFIYFFCLFLVNQQRYSESMAVAIIEILCHQMIAVVWIGWRSGFQYHLILALMLPFLIKKGLGTLKLLLITVVTLSWISLDYHFHDAEPLIRLSSDILSLFNWINVAVLFISITLWSFIFNHEVNIFEDEIEDEHDKAQDLLLNILPESIATRLKNGSKSIADEFENTTVLFSDFVGFTELAESMKPEALVNMLNGIFSKFDDLTDNYGLEKIKTIGDSYMVAAGIPDNREFHACVIADFALDMLNVLDEFNRKNGYKLSVRIGINSGRVVAGVIGKKKFIYDLWGDTVNIASRMESHGIGGEIQVSHATFELLTDTFRLAPRGSIKIKGKGEMMTYMLKGRKEAFKEEVRDENEYYLDI